jgi:hypothetical protein
MALFKKISELLESTELGFVIETVGGVSKKFNLGNLGKKTQYETLPSASENAGKIFQYIGETNENYTNGMFYVSLENGQGQYEWFPSSIMQKVDNATTGDIATLDESGNVTDSGIAASNVINMPIFVSSIEEIKGQLSSYERQQQIFFLKNDIIIDDYTEMVNISNVVFFGGDFIIADGGSLVFSYPPYTAGGDINVKFYNTLQFNVGGNVLYFNAKFAHVANVEMYSVKARYQAGVIPKLYSNTIGVGSSSGTTVNLYTIVPGIFYNLNMNATLNVLHGLQIGNAEIHYTALQNDVTIRPNVLNVWDAAYSGGETLTIAFSDEQKLVTNEYMGQFKTGSTVPTVVFPSDIVWKTAPSLVARKTYQFSVLNGKGIIVEF